MNNSSVQNLEEAANIASEFIYSIDNLPHEVTHILQEIKHKELKAQAPDLQQEIDRDSAKYIRHSLRASSVPASPSSRAPSPKSSALPAKIAASYAEIQQLSSDKCALAQTLIELVSRTRSRLDSDLTKVRVLQGEVVDYPSALGSSITAVPGIGLTALPEPYSVPGRNPAMQVTESLRNALATPTLADIRQASAVPLSASMSSISSGPSATKKRRLGTSIKLTSVATPTKHRSASPTTTAPLVSHQRVASRLSRQSITRHDTEMDEGDDDAEGEDGEGDDERLYCFCQKQSYGDMIACDNEGGCPFEWFHLSCVGMKQPTPEKWYCSVCSANNSKKSTAAATGRKGRKK